MLKSLFHSSYIVCLFVLKTFQKQGNTYNYILNLNLRNNRTTLLKILLILLQFHHKNTKVNSMFFCLKWRHIIHQYLLSMTTIIRNLNVLQSRIESKNPCSHISELVCVCVCVCVCLQSFPHIWVQQIIDFNNMEPHWMK